MPQVSIITPAFRAENFIGRAVSSVLAQTHADWEMVIVADDECDYKAILNSQGIIDSRLRFVRTGGTGRGLSYARNIGLAAASSDMIALLDADDAFYPLKLARMLPMALRYGICTCALDYTRYENNIKHLIRRIGADGKEGLLLPDAYLRTRYSANAIMIFNRNRIPVRWREDFSVMEDLVFIMTAFEYVPAIYHLNESLYEYIYTKNSLSTSPGTLEYFVSTKQNFLELINDRKLGITRADTIAALQWFIPLSIEAEQAYAQAIQVGDTVTFTELLEERLLSQILPANVQ